MPVAEDVTWTNVVTCLLGCIMFLFLNASQVSTLAPLAIPFQNEFAQSFVITDILGVKKIGDIVGTLGFADCTHR